jgi:hypothetical protein
MERKDVEDAFNTVIWDCIEHNSMPLKDIAIIQETKKMVLFQLELREKK